MTAGDEQITGLDAEIVGALRLLRPAPVPDPTPALQALLSASAVVTIPPASSPARRTSVSTPKRLLAAVPSKIAAGVIGALLAASFGAGAMTGTIQLASNDEKVATEVAAPVEATAGDDDGQAAVVGDEAPADNEHDDDADVADEGDGDVAKEAGDPTTAPVPTSLSEAAHNHHFDEVCGNHGAYVSHFARTGEEPECALTARAGEPVAAASDADPAGGDTSSEGSDDAEAAETGATRVEHGKSAEGSGSPKTAGVRSGAKTGGRSGH